MFCIEVEDIVTFTSTINNEDEQKIKDYIKNNPETFEFMSEKEAIIKAIEILSDDCKLELYKDCVESDSQTSDIRWSEFEHRTAADILNN